MLSYKGHTRGKQRFRTLLNPKMIAGVMLGFILLAILLTISNAGAVFQAIGRFPLLLLPIILALFVGRELFRSIEWRVFLNAIGIHASRREAFLTLTGGDAASILPGGLYFQDLLVKREFQTGISEPLAATTLMLWMELTVSMAFLAITGVPGAAWVRPAMAAGVAGSVLILLLGRTRILVAVQQWNRRLADHLGQHWKGAAGRIGGKVLDGLDRFIGSYAPLAHLKVVIAGLLLCAAYMVLTILALYLIAIHLDVRISLWQAVAIYSIMLLVIVIVPLPTDIGLGEFGGVGAFLLFLVPAAVALAALLVFRILTVLAEELVAAAGYLIFHKEALYIFRAKKASPSPSPDQPAETEKAL